MFIHNNLNSFVSTSDPSYQLIDHNERLLFMIVEGDKMREFKLFTHFFRNPFNTYLNALLGAIT